MMRIGKDKTGSALVTALIIATLLLAAEFFLLHQNRNQMAQIDQSTARLQAWFAGRAAMQHAMLKCQLMPTQLYDAAAFSVGKNPYFDFSQYENPLPAIFPQRQAGGIYLKLASPLNPGPRFVAESDGILPGSEYKNWTEIHGFTDADLAKNAPLNPWPKKNSGEEIKTPSLYLWKFYQDIAFSAPTDASMIGHPFSLPDGYPYSFSYEIDDLEVTAIQAQKKYNEDAVKITAKGQITFKNKSYTQNLSSVIRIKRN